MHEELVVEVAASVGLALLAIVSVAGLVIVGHALVEILRGER